MGREARHILGSFAIEKIKGEQDGMFATQRKWSLVQDYSGGRGKKILRRRRGGARRHRERDKGFLWVGGTAAITVGDTKKQAQKTGLCFVG